MNEKEVKITLKEYKRLLKKQAELNMLERGGVDNWEWYGESLNPEYSTGESLDEVEEEIDNADYTNILVEKGE